MMRVTEGWPESRLQLLRRPGRPSGAGPRALIVSGERGTRRLSWDDDGQLLRADVRAAASSEALPSDWEAVEGPQYWVCTHGRRDRCCAKWGGRLYEALERLRPEQTWQTSHLGGHRFAPTLITLPSQLVYGRVEPDEAAAVVAQTEAGRVYAIDRCRGRASRSRAAQLAEIAVWRAIAAESNASQPADALAVEALPTDATTVVETEARFSVRTDGRRFEVDVRTSALRLVASCGDAEKDVRSLRVRSIRETS
jgi:hypothetical protein